MVNMGVLEGQDVLTTRDNVMEVEEYVRRQAKLNVKDCVRRQVKSDYVETRESEEAARRPARDEEEVRQRREWETDHEERLAPLAQRRKAPTVIEGSGVPVTQTSTSARRRRAPQNAKNEKKNGWRMTSSNTATGVFKGARALRSPCDIGIAWTDVVTRTVRDTATDEVIDVYDSRVEQLPLETANGRLTHVADIKVDVTHRDKTGVWQRLLRTATRWADESECETEDGYKSSSEGPAAGIAQAHATAAAQRGVQTGRPSSGDG